MTRTWSAEGDVILPGAVRYTLSSGNEPTDRWHVSMSMPPPNLRDLAGRGPWPTLYVLDAPITFLVAAQTAQLTMAYSHGPDAGPSPWSASCGHRRPTTSAP
jgi:uncharacterized protein